MLPDSVKDVNLNSVSSSYPKKRCRLHNSSSFRGRIEGYKHNADTSVEQVNTNALALIKEKPIELDEFHNNVTVENVASSMKQMTLQPSKEVSNLHSTDYAIPDSTVNVNFNSVSSCYSKKRCKIHNSGSMKRADSFKGKATISSFRDRIEWYNHYADTSIEQMNTNALSLIKDKPKELDEVNMPTMHKRVCKMEHFPGRSTRMIPSADTTSCSQAAMRCNHSNQKGVDNILGVSEDELVKAIEKIVIDENNTPHDRQVLNQKVINNPFIEEKKSLMVDPRWDWRSANTQYDQPIQRTPVLNQTTNFDSVLDGNYLLLDWNNKGSQMADPNDRSDKEVTNADWIPRHYPRSIWSENSLVNQASTSQNVKMRRFDGLTNKKRPKIHNSRSEYLSNQAMNQKNFREGNIPSPMPYQTPIAMEQRRNTGTVPTLLRTTSIGSHAKIDRVKKPEPCYSNQRSRLSRNKTSAQKHQHSHQINSIPSVLEEKPVEKINSIRLTTHQRRGEAQKKNPGAYTDNKHMKPKQKAKSRKTSTTPSSVSSHSYSSGSSNSSDSSSVTSSSESTDSVRSKTTKRSRRKSYSTVDLGSEQESRLMAKTEKQIGRMQRFKNKLGLIFHHHHLHHHHHHDESKVTDLGHATASDHSHLFSNYLRKMLHRTSKDAVGKKNPKQYAQLPLQKVEHGLLDGLLKHVWHAKKSKRSEEVKKKLGKSLSNKKKLGKSLSNKNVKKWHWWQKLHKRKGFVRQASRKKPQVRVGFKANKRQPVRALTLR